MSDSFLRASSINSTVCLCLGWPTNLLLIWLIQNRTVQAMQVWSRVLLHAALIDLLLISMEFLIQPIITIDEENKLFFAYMDGPFAGSTIPTAVILLFFYTFFVKFAKYTIMVQHIYRWLVICRDRELSLWHYTLLLICPAAMAFIIIAFIVVNWFHNNIPDVLCSNCSQNQTIIVAFLLNHLSTQLIGSLMLFCTATTYTVILATTGSIWLRSRRSMMMVTAQQQQQQSSRDISRRQVGYVLLVQAMLPLAFNLVPAVMLYLQVFFGLQRQEWVSLFYTQCWPSALYPMFTVLIVGPYRKWLLGLFDGTFLRPRNAAINSMNDRCQTTSMHQSIVGTGRSRKGLTRVQ